jgi:hypothetical protein
MCPRYFRDRRSLWPALEHVASFNGSFKLEGLEAALIQMILCPGAVAPASGLISRFAEIKGAVNERRYFALAQ